MMKTGMASLLWVALVVLPAPAQDASKDLAPPLRKFDKDKDGKLTGDEITMARQAHHRGGRDAEPDANRWREIMERQKREFQGRREREFDVNNDGKVEGDERKEMEKVWDALRARFTDLRKEITAKYDRNDDGELSGDERNASRGESDRRRRELEDAAVKAWRAARGKPAA